MLTNITFLGLGIINLLMTERQVRTEGFSPYIPTPVTSSKEYFSSFFFIFRHKSSRGRDPPEKCCQRQMYPEQRGESKYQHKTDCNLFRPRFYRECRAYKQYPFSCDCLHLFSFCGGLNRPDRRRAPTLDVSTGAQQEQFRALMERYQIYWTQNERVHLRRGMSGHLL